MRTTHTRAQRGCSAVLTLWIKAPRAAPGRARPASCVAVWPPSSQSTALSPPTARKDRRPPRAARPARSATAPASRTRQSVRRATRGIGAAVARHLRATRARTCRPRRRERIAPRPTSVGAAGLTARRAVTVWRRSPAASVRRASTTRLTGRRHSNAPAVRMAPTALPAQSPCAHYRSSVGTSARRLSRSTCGDVPTPARRRSCPAALAVPTHRATA